MKSDHGYDEPVLHRLIRVLTILPVAFALATAALWADSYWRDRVFRLAHDTPVGNGWIQIKISGGSLRGGFDLDFTFERGMTPESFKQLQNDHLWRHSLELWSGTTEEIDAAMPQSQTWRDSYLFTPTTPSTFGFQFSSHQGFNLGTHFLQFVLAIPYWFPVSLLLILPSYRAWRSWRRRSQVRQGICPVCGYRFLHLGHAERAVFTT